MRKAPFVEFDTNVMVSLFVRCDIHINVEAGGTHDRVAALFLDDGLSDHMSIQYVSIVVGNLHHLIRLHRLRLHEFL